jgi:hypothetical protein
MLHRIRLALILVGAGLLAATVVSAQDLTPDRVQTAISITDVRIEQAQRLVADSDNQQARGEVAIAVDLQGRAKSALSASQLAPAVRLTLDARGHADRAIALVKGLPDPDRVLAQLERTREMLDRARQRIDECNNDRARSMVRAALEIQQHAEDAAGSGRYLGALQLTMSARERALRALRLCRLDDDPGASAERALRRTSEVIARARDPLSGGAGGEPARQALARASDLQEEAMRQFRAQHFEAALRITTSSRAFAHRAIRLSARMR